MKYICILFLLNCLGCTLHRQNVVGLYVGKAEENGADLILKLNKNKTFEFQKINRGSWCNFGTYKVKKNKLVYYNYNLIDLPVKIIQAKDDSIPKGFIKIKIEKKIYKVGWGSWFIQTNSGIFKDTSNDLYPKGNELKYIRIMSNESHRISKKITINPDNNYFVILSTDSLSLKPYYPFQRNDSLSRAKVNERTLKGKNTLLKKSTTFIDGKITFGLYSTMELAKDSVQIQKK